MSPDSYRNTTKYHSERQRKIFTNSFIGGIFNNVYDCMQENFRSHFKKSLVLPRLPRVNESVFFADLELELRKPGSMVIYVVDGKIFQSFPIEFYDEDESPRIDKAKTSIYLYDNKEFFDCPWIKGGKLSFPVTRQVEIEYKDKTVTDVTARWLVYKSSPSPAWDLEPFYFLGVSNYINNSNQEWIEQSRSYYRPNLKYMFDEIEYKRNTVSGKLELVGRLSNYKNFTKELNNADIFDLTD